MKHLASLIWAVFVAMPAMATPSTVSPEVLQEHQDLVVGIQRLGVRILFDHPYVCQKQKWFGAYASDGSEFVLCGNVKSTQADRLYTIKHEAWHVYQDLKDCSLTDAKALKPVFAISKVPQAYVTFATRSYSMAEVPIEAEAYWAEDTFTAREIHTLIIDQAKRCSFKL